MSRRRRDKRVWFVVLGAFVAVFLFTFLTQKFKGSEDTEAASLAGFDPGYIISDYQMSNYNSMSEAEIQNFLKQKGNCNDTRTYLASYYPNLHYHIKDGHFVCLADETFGDGTAYGESAPGGASAAHIIWQAAQDYKINPQVLIVLLQKEQGLITDSWPNDRQYKTATGYGCPDTAPCSSQYYGFKNQVRKAAALFRTVLDGGWTNYPLGNNYIQYNPDADCGGSVVNIRSLATSALYRYTPYQPNAGALAAGYGTAHCGAYGNRNFYLYFEDWFGGVTKAEDLIKELTYGGVRTIEDGTYQIISQLSNDFVIDIEGGVTKDSRSGKIGLWTRKKDLSNAENQLFDVKYDEGTGFYTIINSVSGLSLDVFNSNSADGTEIIAWPQNSGCNQKWVINKYDDGYEISSACTGKVLDVPHSLAQRGQKVTIYKKKDSKNQRWSFNVVSEEKYSGNYNIVAKGDSNLVLDISGGVREGMGSGSAIIYMKKENNNLNQVFKFKRDDESGYYFIYNPYSNLYLDVYGGYMTDETKIIFWPYNGACNQKWKLEPEEDYYYISSSCSDKVIDIRGGNLVNKTDLIIYRRHDSYNQQWFIKEI